MKLTRRDRRVWRIFLWGSLASALISGWFGYAIRPATDSPLQGVLQGVATSLLIATPIIFVEIHGSRLGILRRLRRLPLAIYFGITATFYFVVIIGGLLTMRVLTATNDAKPFALDALFQRAIIFSVAMAVFGNVVFVVGGLLGFGTLKSFLTGRYVQPKREQKAFLLIDMKDSTGLAERLGAIRFHELLNAFFRDIADAALDCDAEIHKYVGDEAILSWPLDAALADGDCLACHFIVRDIIAGNASRYQERFGAVPSFRASLHCGEIVAGEIGDVRREIAYVGDTLNVAARLLEAAKSTGHDVLVSADLLAVVTRPADLSAEALPTLEVRGRRAPLEIFALDRSAPTPASPRLPG